MFNRPLPAPARDVALLVGRIVLGVVLFAHGWQKLMINGIGGTYGQFEKMGIPLAIVSASFASFVEFVGGVLLIVGALTTTVVALDVVVMVGAAGFVHVTHGIFAADGGWELVGVIVAAELALAATGPGRFSVDHVLAARRARHDAVLAPAATGHRAPPATAGTFTEAVRRGPHRTPQHVGGARQVGPIDWTRYAEQARPADEPFPAPRDAEPAPLTERIEHVEPAPQPAPVEATVPAELPQRVSRAQPVGAATTAQP